MIQTSKIVKKNLHKKRTKNSRTIRSTKKHRGDKKKTIFITPHKIRNKSKSILSPARFVREFPCHESLSHGTKKVVIS